MVSGGRFYAAIIDDVAIFNVALDNDDIETLMNDGLKTAAAIEPSDKLATIWAAIKAD